MIDLVAMTRSAFIFLSMCVVGAAVLSAIVAFCALCYWLDHLRFTL